MKEFADDNTFIGSCLTLLNIMIIIEQFWIETYVSELSNT